VHIAVVTADVDGFSKDSRRRFLVRLYADNEVCEGHAQCAMVDDELFTLDEDGYIDLGDGVDVTADKEQAAQLGADACPVQALLVQ
jgi:ferredoxin